MKARHRHALGLAFVMAGTTACGTDVPPIDAETGFRVTHETQYGDLELIVQGDKYRFRLTSNDEREESLWMVSDGTDALWIEFEGPPVPGPDTEYRLVLDVARQPAYESPIIVVPDQDDVPGLVPFTAFCHRKATGTYAGRAAEKYVCGGNDSGREVVWVDQATRVPLTPWSIDGSPAVDDSYEVPPGTFDVSTPEGADVRIIHPPLRVGDLLPDFTVTSLDEQGQPLGTTNRADFAGRPFAVALISSSVFQRDMGPTEERVQAPLQTLSRLTAVGGAPAVLAVIAKPQKWWYGFTRNGITVPVAWVADEYRLAASLGLANPDDKSQLVLVKSDGTVSAVLDLQGLTDDGLREALDSVS